MQFQSWEPNVLASQEGISLPAPFSPNTEGLSTSIMPFSFTGCFWVEEYIKRSRGVQWEGDRGGQEESKGKNPQASATESWTDD